MCRGTQMTEQARDLSRGPTPQPMATGHASPAEPQPRSLIFLQKQFVCRQDAAHPPEASVSGWTFHGDFTSMTFRALRKERGSTPVLVASEQRAGTFRSGWEGPRCPWTTRVDPTGEEPPLHHGNWPSIRKCREAATQPRRESGPGCSQQERALRSLWSPGPPGAEA